MSGVNYEAYLKVCRQAGLYPEVYNRFRGHPDYAGVVETVGLELGRVYAQKILKDYPELISLLDVFADGDFIGSPFHYYAFEGLDQKISPTTLRYMVVLGDLLKLFGSLDGMDIVEIGVGFGGQCKVINAICKPKSYTLIDLPEVLALSEKYLKYYNIPNLIFRSSEDIKKTSYDFCISNYAFTELSRDYQEQYAATIIKQSKQGYMICNYLNLRKGKNDGFSKLEIKKLRPRGEFINEDPLTDPNNAIYIWK